MVPMFDNLNHNNFMIGNDLINLDLHVKGKKEKNFYFQQDKYLANHSEIFKANDWKEKDILDKNDKILGRFSRDIFEMNQKLLGAENICEKLTQTEK